MTCRGCPNAVTRATNAVAPGAVVEVRVEEKSIPLFRKGCPFTQSGCVVTTSGSGKSLLEISTPGHPHTSKKHGKGHADGCDQASHRGSLAENVGIGESGWISPY